MTPKIILQPNDCTQHAESAYEVAAALAKQHGAKLILLYVKASQDILVGEFGTLPPEPEPTEAEYGARLKQLAALNSDVPTDCLVAHGIPVTEILRVAKESSCDLIVLGSHAHSWLGRMMTGDLVEKVAGKAKCPVVTVRSPA